MGEAIYPVPSEWSANALIDDARYQEMYRRSVEEPDAFWREEAQRIEQEKRAEAKAEREKPEPTEAERKAARDAKYAARKKRKG